VPVFNRENIDFSHSFGFSKFLSFRKISKSSSKMWNWSYSESQFLITKHFEKTQSVYIR